MRRLTLIVVAVLLLLVNVVSADIIGAGANQLTIDFVEISGDASNANGTTISDGSPGDSWHRSFTDPGDFRMGTYEITHDQWRKFRYSLGGKVTGSPYNAYDETASFSPSTINAPTNEVSWYEAAQFVNYLNTSTGHQPAYKFTGTQGTKDYNLGIWSIAESAGGINRHRHKDAFYFLPTEDEWIKAAYWNGSIIQTYSTTDDSKPIEDVDSNYRNQSVTKPWSVGSGSEELNGTYDMMGNVWEWLESPYIVDNYGSTSKRAFRGGAYDDLVRELESTWRFSGAYTVFESGYLGFRVASVPEPCTLVLLSLGGFLIRRRRA